MKWSVHGNRLQIQAKWNKKCSKENKNDKESSVAPPAFPNESNNEHEWQNQNNIIGCEHCQPNQWCSRQCQSRSPHYASEGSLRGAYRFDTHYGNHKN